MKTILALLVVLLVSCEQRSKDVSSTSKTDESVKTEKPLIRTISFYGTKDDFGIELNGDRGFLRQESVEPKRIEMPYVDALKLLEDFYAIPNIKIFLGGDSDGSQSSTHYLVNIYDEVPEHYSEEWIEYALPKDKVAQSPELIKWLTNMRTMRKKVAEQGASSDR